jgi:hypothetical protein
MTRSFVVVAPANQEEVDGFGDAAAHNGSFEGILPLVRLLYVLVVVKSLLGYSGAVVMLMPR